MALLVRTWNLFHGNTSPPVRRGYLRQMIELISRDRPDVVCLQELPIWSLGRLERWSGMHAVGAVARRPRLPLANRPLTALHHGILRSALTDEGGAILTKQPARDLGTTVVGREKLRRIAHAVDLDGVTVVNFHVDRGREQLARVLALAGERAIAAGDANTDDVSAEGFSGPLAGSLDQILVRGVSLVDGPRPWPVGRRTLDGHVLSDHAPVEAVVE